MKIKLDLDYEQVDEVVRAALMDTFRSEWAEEDLREAITVVLEHYMSHDDHANWLSSEAV